MNGSNFKEIRFAKKTFRTQRLASHVPAQRTHLIYVWLRTTMEIFSSWKASGARASSVATQNINIYLENEQWRWCAGGGVKIGNWVR